MPLSYVSIGRGGGASGGGPEGMIKGLLRPHNRSRRNIPNMFPSISESSAPNNGRFCSFIVDPRSVVGALSVANGQGQRGRSSS